MSGRGWGVVFALVGVLALSFRPIWIKLAYAVPAGAGHGVSPVTLLFMRMAIALPFFAVIAWVERHRQPALGPRDWAALAGLGFIGYYAASFLDFLGLVHVGAGVGRLIQFLYPTMVLLLSFVFLGVQPTRRMIVALAMSYAGIVCVVWEQVGAGPGGPRFLWGATLILVSAGCYAVYLVAGSRWVQRVGSMRFTANTMLVATVPAIAQFVIVEPATALAVPVAVWGYAGAMAILSTVLPVFLVAEALRRVGANQFALIGAVGPVSATLLGVVGLDEPFSAGQVLGGALVIIGVVLVCVTPPAAESPAR